LKRDSRLFFEESSFGSWIDVGQGMGVFKLFVTVKGSKRGRPAGNHRLVLDGVFWIARTGAPWRDLPDHFGNWNSVYQQFRRWSVSGLWDTMLEALNATGAALSSVQMIDSTIVRAHQHAAGAKGGAQDIGRSRGGVANVACREPQDGPKIQYGRYRCRKGIPNGRQDPEPRRECDDPVPSAVTRIPGRILSTADESHR
jgi:transposase